LGHSKVTYLQAGQQLTTREENIYIVLFGRLSVLNQHSLLGQVSLGWTLCKEIMFQNWLNELVEADGESCLIGIDKILMRKILKTTLASNLKDYAVWESTLQGNYMIKQ
jgi:hypothetical protein